MKNHFYIYKQIILFFELKPIFKYYRYFVLFKREFQRKALFYNCLTYAIVWEMLLFKYLYNHTIFDSIMIILMTFVSSYLLFRFLKYKFNYNPFNHE